MKIIRAFSIVVSLSFISNLLGFIRDVALAATFGASSTSDAYFAAFFVPNTLYLILIAGSISSAYIPIFMEYYGKDREKALRFGNTVFNVAFLVLAATILTMMLTINLWMRLLFPGFEELTMQMSIELSLIILPMLLFVGLSGLLTATLNSLEHFTVPAIAPLISNILVICSIILSGFLGGIYGVAVGVLVGMLVQLLVQIPVLLKYGVHYQAIIDLKHPALPRLLKLTLPLFGYLAVAYASVIIERMIASSLSEGTISAMNYAIRLFSLPLTIVSASLGTVIYPRMVAQATRGDTDRLAESVSTAIGAIVFLLTPVSIWLVLNHQLVVRLLYGYGRFSTEDIQVTATILAWYTIGMVPTGVTSLIQRGFYAAQNTSVPLFIEAINLAIYIVVATGLTYLFGLVGLASARAISFFTVLLISSWFFWKYSRIAVDRQKLLKISKNYGLAISLATTIWALNSWIPLEIYLPLAGQWSAPLVTGINGITGLILYLGFNYKFALEKDSTFRKYYSSAMEKVSRTTS